MNRDLIRENFYLWTLSFFKLPLLFFCRPRIVATSNSEATIKIPLRRRTKNHLGSMYFGALCAGADACGGFLASKLIRKSGKKINLLFKDLKADFVKRAEKDVYFVCNDGERIKRLINTVIQTKSRGNEKITVTAYVKEGETQTTVAQFEMTLSLKEIA